MQVSVKVTADMDLADHLLSFLKAALSSPEAQHALPLRKAFVLVLLDLGKSAPACTGGKCLCSLALCSAECRKSVRQLRIASSAT